MKPANFNGLGLDDRFWSKVDFNGPVARAPLTPCWIWTASKVSGGYGQFGTGTRGAGTFKNNSTHRLVLDAKLGREIRNGYQACHRCDVKACVNPGHLFEDDNAGNCADKVAKGRQAKGETNGYHKLTEDDIRAIRAAVGTQEEIAARFGVSQSAVSSVKLRKRWKHVA